MLCDRGRHCTPSISVPTLASDTLFSFVPHPHTPHTNASNSSTIVRASIACPPRVHQTRGLSTLLQPHRGRLSMRYVKPNSTFGFSPLPPSRMSVSSLASSPFQIFNILQAYNHRSYNIHLHSIISNSNQNAPSIFAFAWHMVMQCFSVHHRTSSQVTENRSCQPAMPANIFVDQSN